MSRHHRCCHGRYLRALRERLPCGLSAEDASTITFRFLLGRSANASVEAALDVEAAKHGDILRVSVYDCYDNLFPKVRKPMRLKARSGIGGWRAVQRAAHQTMSGASDVTTVPRSSPATARARARPCCGAPASARRPNPPLPSPGRSLQLIAGYRWAEHHLDCCYVAHADDDSFVRLERLYDELRHGGLPARGLYYGYFWNDPSSAHLAGGGSRTRPIRDAAAKS